MPNNRSFRTGAVPHRPIDQCRKVESKFFKHLKDNLMVPDKPMRLLRRRQLSKKVIDSINNNDRHSFHNKARLKDPTKTEDVELEQVQVEDREQQRRVHQGLTRRTTRTIHNLWLHGDEYQALVFFHTCPED